MCTVLLPELSWAARRQTYVCNCQFGGTEDKAGKLPVLFSELGLYKHLLIFNNLQHSYHNVKPLNLPIFVLIFVNHFDTNIGINYFTIIS